jgi:hypothetical protein
MHIFVLKWGQITSSSEDSNEPLEFKKLRKFLDLLSKHWLHKTVLHGADLVELCWVGLWKVCSDMVWCGLDEVSYGVIWYISSVSLVQFNLVQSCDLLFGGWLKNILTIHSSKASFSGKRKSYHRENIEENIPGSQCCVKNNCQNISFYREGFLV